MVPSVAIITAFKIIIAKKYKKTSRRLFNALSA
jgi:hypothetical protein